MIKYNYILLLLLTVLTSSCVTIDQLSIDYLQPAKVSFPSAIKTVGIVNNTIEKKERTLKEKRDQFNRVINSELDFQGDPKITTESFASKIAEANYFDQVIICDSALREKDHFPREAELTPDEVKQLTTDLGVDMLLAVEDVNIETKQKTEDFDDFFRSTIDATVKPVIRAYISTRNKPLITAYPDDKIFWEGYGRNPIEAQKDLIKEDSLIKEASDFAGEIPVKYLIPTWDKADRYYYISGCVELRDGAVLLRENSWDDALKQWQLAYEKSSKRIKMRAAFNIALYYETHDDIDKAIEWVEKAKVLMLEKEKIKESSPETKETIVKSNKSTDYLVISHYLISLQERQKDIQTLNLQMERFNSKF